MVDFKVQGINTSSIDRSQGVKWGVVNPVNYRSPEEKPQTGESWTGINTNLGIGSEISYPTQCELNRNGRTIGIG